MNAEHDTENRQEILQWAQAILADGTRRTVKEIQAMFQEEGWNIYKPLLNSVLHREGRAIFHYDYKTYQHWYSTNNSASHLKALENAEERHAEAPQDSKRGASETNVPGGNEEPQTESIRAITTHDGFSYRIDATEIDSPSFFTVTSHGSQVHITLNKTHSMYKYIHTALDNKGRYEEETAKALMVARNVITLLLVSWARYEVEQPNEVRVDYIRDVRHDWSRIISRLLRR